MYKIYKIVDNTNNNIYIGHTKSELKIRIRNHKNYIKQNKFCSSSLILKNENYYYETIEETDDKEREKYWIQNTPNCINKIKYDFNILEWRKINEKKWNKICREKHKDKIALQKKKDYEFKKSWGGDPRYNNNLLNIDVNLFNTS